jgi:hypothetical protein
MLLIPVRVGPSAIEGNGLLAAVDLPAGTPVWRFQPGFDQAFAPRDFEALPAIARAHLRHFAWMRRDDAHWILSGDLACFMVGLLSLLGRFLDLLFLQVVFQLQAAQFFLRHLGVVLIQRARAFDERLGPVRNIRGLKLLLLNPLVIDTGLALELSQILSPHHALHVRDRSRISARRNVHVLEVEVLCEFGQALGA